jgi:hypothetical protein
MKSILVTSLIFLALSAGKSASAFSYGAISYSPSTTQTGVAWGAFSQAQAEYEANTNCGFPDCQPAVWVANACGAIAIGETITSEFGWGVNRYAELAQQTAINACSQIDFGCHVIASVCSF